MKILIALFLALIPLFSCTALAVSPEVTGIIPSTVIQGYFFNEQYPLVINGENFTSNCSVEIGTDSLVYAVSCESSLTLEVIALISSYESTGSQEVVVTNLSGESGSSWINVVTPEVGPTFEVFIDGATYREPISGIPSTEVSAEGFSASFIIYTSSAPLSWSLSRVFFIINGNSYAVASGNFTQITSTSAIATCEVRPASPFPQGSTILGAFSAQDNYGNAGTKSLALVVWEDAGDDKPGPGGGRGRNVRDPKRNINAFVKLKDNRSYWRPKKENLEMQLRLVSSELYIGDQGVRVLGIAASGQKVIDYTIPGAFTGKKNIAIPQSAINQFVGSGMITILIIDQNSKEILQRQSIMCIAD